MKKKILALFSVLLLLTGCSLMQQRIRLGTGDVGGTYYQFGNALSALSSLSSFSFEVKSTAGSAANLRLLSEGYLQLAISQTDLMQDAYFGTGTFEGNSYQGYLAIAALYTEACQIVVRDDSSISSVEDLEGSVVAIGEAESGTAENALQILQAYGLTTDMVQTVYMTYSQATVALEQEEIAAFFCTAGAPTAEISALDSRTAIRLLSLDSTIIQRMTDTYPYFSSCTIPANTYTGQTGDVLTLGVKAVLLASDQISESKVQTITKVLFAEKDNLQGGVSTELWLTPDYAVDGIPIPFHPGAAAYYSSLGITVETED